MAIHPIVKVMLGLPRPGGVAVDETNARVYIGRGRPMRGTQRRSRVGLQGPDGSKYEVG